MLSTELLFENRENFDHQVFLDQWRSLMLQPSLSRLAGDASRLAIDLVLCEDKIRMANRAAAQIWKIETSHSPEFLKAQLWWLPMMAGFLENHPDIETLSKQLQGKIVGSKETGELRNQDVVLKTVSGLRVDSVACVNSVLSSFSAISTHIAELFNTPDPVHSLISAPLIEVGFAHLHPFMDGNGRTSRSIASFLLFKAGLNSSRIVGPLEVAYHAGVTWQEQIRLCKVQKTPANLVESWLNYYCNLLIRFEGETSRSLK